MERTLRSAVQTLLSVSLSLSLTLVFLFLFLMGFGLVSLVAEKM
jgi:hypothetical protein